MTFAPVSRMCLYCKERIFITEPVDEVTCPKCGEVMKVVMGRKLRLSRIIVSLAEKPSNLPVVEKTLDNSSLHRAEKTEHKQKMTGIF